MRFTTDMEQDLHQAALRLGVSVDQFKNWLSTDAEDDFARLPYLGRVREVVHYRLSNAQDPWEANDLNDLHYLSCAAGYADVVVAEKKFAHYLRRAGRAVSGDAVVVPTLMEAAALLHRTLAADAA